MAGKAIFTVALFYNDFPGFVNSSKHVYFLACYICIICLLLTLLRVSYALWVGYFLIRVKQNRIQKSLQTANTYPPVSVIICAKNEAENLKKYLPLVLAQDYPMFEVLVVNDASTDNTALVLKEMLQKQAHLKVITILAADKKSTGGKRQALQKGIEQAQHNCLLLTDADCYPASKNWIALMAQNFSKEKEIVLGFGPYQQASGCLNIFVRYETLHTALQYLALAFAGIPYMGVGRNLAYTKRLFLTSGGFGAAENLASGDDDLFVNRVATSGNTALQIQPDAFCYSVAPYNYKAWFRQKTRHLGAGKHYKKRHIVFLSLLSAIHFLFYGMLIVVFFAPLCTKPVLLFWLAALLLQWFVYAVAGSIFKTGGMLLWPLLDVLHLLYYLIFIPFALATKEVKWRQ